MGKIFKIELTNRIRIHFLGIKLSLKRSGKYRIEHLLCEIFSRFCKVNKKKIVFINNTNWQYACNPKYIAEEMLKRNSLDVDLVWIYNSQTDLSLIPDKFRLVDYNSVQALYEFASAKVWVLNSHLGFMVRKGLRKSEDTIVFQTFHGSMGIKKTTKDAEDIDISRGWTFNKIFCSFVDYLFMDSQMEADIYRSAFYGYGEIKKLGKARDCIFYKDPTPYIQKVKEYYDIPPENKILMYAPTWRVNDRNYCYNIDIKLLRRCLEKRFGGSWSILIRAHNIMKKKIYNALYNKNEVINVTDYIDMQELLVASDILISDYSSTLPEYTILKKPSFIYAMDLEEYENGFYYPLNTLPSPIATDNYELANNILNFDEKLFKQRAEEFLIKMEHKDDENSCKRIVDFILEKQGEE